MQFTDKNYWALILGGSSGFGLATAKKLSSWGMNICVVHRDRRGAMARIEEEFAAIKNQKVKFLSYNTDALSTESRKEILDDLQNQLEGGKIRTLLHSIAFGNLKLTVPQKQDEHPTASEMLARKLGIPKEKLAQVANELFTEGIDALMDIADPAVYNNELLLGEEDLHNTVYAMGTSLLTWSQDVFQKNLFAADARIFGMTSEGNTTAWRGYAAVSAAKAALEAVSRSLALEMAAYGIRSNIIQAGVTDTPALRLIPGNRQLVAAARKRNPFKRLTLPQDVAAVIALLSLDEAAWVNGEVIRVDGGEHIAG